MAITDSFPGSSLGAGWNIDPAGDTPTVASNTITCAPGGTGAAVIYRSETLTGATVRLKINLADTAVTAVGVSTTGIVTDFVALAEWASGFLVVTDSNSDVNLTSIAMTAGTYVLELVTDVGGAITATLYDATMSTVIGTTSSTATGAALAALAGPLHPVIEIGASTVTSWTDFFADEVAPPPPPPASVPGRLRFVLTDLDGTPLGPALQETSVGEVVIPLSDSRTGTVAVSMYDPAAAPIASGKVAAKVVYGDELVFAGVILKASDDFAAGVVTCTLHDMTIRPKHRNLRYGHSSVDASLDPNPGIPVDGTGFRMLLTDIDDGGGSIPKSGIDTGTDDVPPQPVATDPDALYVKVTRGQNAWDAMSSLSEAAAGFDIDFAPVDADHPGANPWAAGIFCEARTTPRQGLDRSQANTDGNAPVVFAFGRELSGLVYAPDAEQMKNYAVQVAPGGQADPLDAHSKAGAFDHSSWVDYGIWEDWQSSGETLATGVRQTVLKNRALAVVTAYGTPPEFFTCTTDTDRPGGYQYPTDFAVGDVITAVGKRGFRSVVVHGRIVQVKLSQRDANGNAQIECLCVPHHTDPAGVAFDE